MKCEDLQLNIPLYADNDLTVEEQTILEEHLDRCPPCRVKLSEFQSIKNDLRILSRPLIPQDLVHNLRSAVTAELKPVNNKSWINLSEEWREWLQYRLMPYCVGTAVSLFLTFSFLLSLDSTKQSTEKVLEVARADTQRNVILTTPTRTLSEDGPFLTETEFAALRTPVSSESPSLNPNGALLALTKSFVRGKMKDDEVTFVADVLSNGLAEITQVVEAPRSRQSLEELSNALENDPDYAPFVSSTIDKRSDVVRVVFKIQRVDVFEDKPAKKKNPVK